MPFFEVIIVGSQLGFISKKKSGKKSVDWYPETLQNLNSSLTIRPPVSSYRLSLAYSDNFAI